MDGLDRHGPRPDLGAVRQQHSRAYDRWTAGEDAELLAAYRAGRGIEELAFDFQRQPSAIESRLRKLAFDLLRSQRPAG